MSVRLVQKVYATFFALALAAALWSVGMPVLRVHSQSSGYSDFAGGSKGQIDVVLHADQAPDPGGTATFTFAAKPWLAAPNLTITWDLPDGGELIGGPAVEAMGAVAVGTTVTQTRQLRFPTPGVYTVRVRATYQPDAATTLGASGVLFFTIDANGSTAADSDPRLEPYVAPDYKPTIDKSGKVQAAGTWETNVPEGCFKVHGFLTREDRQGAANPPRYVDRTGSAVPVHHMLVEMREEDTISDDSYGHTVTDANGYFEFNFCDDDGFLNDELELYFRFCSEVWDGHQIARIVNLNRDLYCFDSGTIDSEGGDVNFDVTVWKLDTVQAAVGNIGDSLYWATKYWNDNLNPGVPRMDRSVTVNWDRARKFVGAFYNDASQSMTLGDDASDPDEWDDTVIIHEWGHFTDHQFSCNLAPGGNHSFAAVNAGPNGDKLAFSEGWGDYLQSAVRTIIPSAGDVSYYIDVDTAVVDLEAVANANARSESGVASMLWDFLDSANDGSDTVSHGEGRIQQVFTDPGYKNNNQCNMQRFLQVWKDLGMPTDAATAATVVQNVNIAKPFGVAVAADTSPLSDANLATVANLAGFNAVQAAAPQQYRWWDQATMVVDNSTSMAQPAGTSKLDAVKTLIGEQVADLSANPRGTETNIYRFDAGSLNPTPVLEGKFFPDQINPVLGGLAADGSDSGCPTAGLYALSQAIQNKYDGQAWLYTDGDALHTTTVDFIQQQLNNRLIHGSVVLLGGCSTAVTSQGSVTGNEKNYLGLAADGSQATGIVPYLLTAIGTGGTFLYVSPGQLPNATDILRAQYSHSAGAGRWSDYVSSTFTYRWDRLQSWEYNWITPSTYKGQSAAGWLEIAGLPAMKVYDATYDKVQVSSYGTIHMGDPTTPGNPLSRDLDVLFNFDIDWYYDSNPNLAAANTPDAPNAGYIQSVYADDLGDWVVITETGEDDPTRQTRTFQALINKNTGEIRYQYQALAGGDSAGASIGLSESEFTIGYSNSIYASINSVSGATPGMGYKFTPAPPQPSKTYTVAVDAQMSGVGFLLTGYSGVLNPMSIVDPTGTAVDCEDTANVLCLSLNGGLLQYVQVNVNDNTGIYSATVSGEGTFSFNAMAASAIQSKAVGQRTLALEPHAFLLDLGRAAAGNQLTGWLQTPTGARFGSSFAFFDDGAHGDGGAGDGLFGSEDFTPPGQGVAYLWVQGTVNGTGVTRSDPSPFNFQPVKVAAEPAEVQGFIGSSILVDYAVTNQDSVQHCYYWEVEVPNGFVFDSSSGSPFCVASGETGHPYATLSYPMDSTPGGVNAEINANFVEVEEGRIVGGATTKVTLVRPLEDVEFDNRWQEFDLRPNGTDTVTMSVNLLDDQGQISGWTGLLGYTLNSTLGSVSAPTGRFVDGRMPVAFTSGTETGTALITFVLEGGATTTTTLQISAATARSLDLVATPTDLRDKAQTTAELVATLRDEWGDPVEGQMVRLSVSDDDGRAVNGTINGSTVFTTTTDANGQVSATYTKGDDQTFTATVRAEALVPQGSGYRVTHEDSEILLFSGQPPNQGRDNDIFMPLIRSK